MNDSNGVRFRSIDCRWQQNPWTRNDGKTSFKVQSRSILFGYPFGGLVTLRWSWVEQKSFRGTRKRKHNVFFSSCSLVTAAPSRFIFKIYSLWNYFLNKKLGKIAEHWSTNMFLIQASQPLAQHSALKSTDSFENKIWYGTIRYSYFLFLSQNVLLVAFVLAKTFGAGPQ
jgi:hypothetical protein